MGRDARRTLLVVGHEVDLFAALRPELDPAMVQVTWTVPELIAEAADAAVPWPWAIAGTGGELAVPVIEPLSGSPVLWFWLGTPPATVPSGTRAHAKWREVLVDIQGCLGRCVGGVRLAPNRGLLSPEAGLVLSPELEALVSAAPAPMRLSSRAARAAARAVERHRLPLKFHNRDGAVALSGSS
ncbi:MAG: hypothetical protein ABR598_09590 [Candidatus Dormibacteria bacterium]